MSGASEIAEALFSHVAHENQRATSLDVRFVQSPHQRQQHRQPAGIVANAGPAKQWAVALYLDVGTRGKHGIQMSGDHQRNTRVRSRTLADDISTRVHADILQARILEALFEIESSVAFGKRGRRNFGDPDLLGQGFGLDRFQEIQRKARCGQRHLRVRTISHGRGAQHEANQEGSESGHMNSSSKAWSIPERMWLGWALSSGRRIPSHRDSDICRVNSEGTSQGCPQSTRSARSQIPGHVIAWSTLS
jgi:hypothetical protein